MADGWAWCGNIGWDFIVVEVVFQEGVYGGGVRGVVEVPGFLKVPGQKAVKRHVHCSFCPGETGSQRYHHIIRREKLEMMK